MAVMQLQFWPAEVLRTRAAEVTEFGPELAKVLEDMAETMYVENGIGLAAPQVGLSQRMIVIDVPEDEERSANLRLLVNPEIVESVGTTLYDEGCLSFPGVNIEVKRAQQVTVKYQDAMGTEHTIEADGLEAICLQHELDHLNGINFVDYLSPLKRKLVLRELKKTLADRH
ncbi:MAG: peptide deformylase [Myxococcota bacterium]|jgi:peptide deformylase